MTSSLEAERWARPGGRHVDVLRRCLHSCGPLLGDGFEELHHLPLVGVEGQEKGGACSHHQ
eukprot:8068701-Prorocentrum_lima.AAC.1